MNENFSIGGRIREFRKGRALSQEQVANLAEITPAYMGQVERGEKNVTVYTLDKICAALNISLGEFFNPIEEPDKTIDEVSTQILHQLAHRTTEEKQAVLRLVKLVFQIQDMK